VFLVCLLLSSVLLNAESPSALNSKQFGWDCRSNC